MFLERFLKLFSFLVSMTVTEKRKKINLHVLYLQIIIANWLKVANNYK
jgi:hypothetical protein